MRAKDSCFDLPDLSFAKYCEEVYGINRGIYHTVDVWLFEKGLDQIIERRKAILIFFQSIAINNQKVKFGPKGLTVRLKQFWEKSYR